MNRFLLSIVLTISVFLPSYGQITITNSNFPEAGDTLFTAVDNLPTNIEITPAGGDQSWDFTSLQSPFTRQTVVKPASEGSDYAFFPEAELFIDLGESAEGYFNVTNDRLEMIGFSGEDPLGQGLELTTRIDPPVVERRAPMNFFDVHEMDAALLVPFSADDLPPEIINQLPITPDSIRIRVAIDRLDVIDAWGTMTIPGGIYDVLREKRTEIRNTRLDAKIGVLPWQDITDIALQFLNIDALGIDTTVTYLFMSNEAIEPIALVTMNDEETQVTNIEYKANDLTTSVQNVSALNPGVYAYPNPAIVSVRFEFSGLNPGDYTLKIYNILGIEVWKNKYYINGNRTEKVDITALRKGTYLYSLEDKRGKTITTKRLIVVRP